MPKATTPSSPRRRPDGWRDVAVQRGDAVKTGELLFTLDDTSQASARDQAIAAIALAARPDARSARPISIWRRRNWCARADLLRDSAGTKQAYDVAKANYDQAVAQDRADRRAGSAGARRPRQCRATNFPNATCLAHIGPRRRRLLSHRRIRAGDDAGRLDPAAGEHLCPLLRAGDAVRAASSSARRSRSAATAAPRALTATITFIAQQEEFTPPVIFSIGSREKLVFKIEARAPGGLKLNPGQPVEVRPL